MGYILGYLLFALIADAWLAPPIPVREADDSVGIKSE